MVRFGSKYYITKYICSYIKNVNKNVIKFIKYVYIYAQVKYLAFVFYYVNITSVKEV